MLSVIGMLGLMWKPNMCSFVGRKLWSWLQQTATIVGMVMAYNKQLECTIVIIIAEKLKWRDSLTLLKITINLILILLDMLQKFMCS